MPTGEPLLPQAAKTEKRLPAEEDGENRQVQNDEQGRAPKGPSRALVQRGRNSFLDKNH